MFLNKKIFNRKQLTKIKTILSWHYHGSDRPTSRRAILLHTVGTTEVGISGGPPFWLIE